MFIAISVENDGNSKSSTSVDGITWSTPTLIGGPVPVPPALFTASPSKIWYVRATSKLLALGGPEIVYLSNDGLSWTSHLTGITTPFGGEAEVVWTGQQWIMYWSDGVGGLGIHTSPDGITWTLFATGVLNFMPSEVILTSAGDFVITSGQSDTPIWYSNDGFSWSLATTPSISGDWFIESPLLLITGGFNPIGNFQHTFSSVLPRGDWTAGTDTIPSELNSPVVSTLRRGIYGNGIYVIVGVSGLLVYSVDGISWTSVPSGIPLDGELEGVAYGFSGGVDVYVAVGRDSGNFVSGHVIYSNNAIDWTSGVTALKGEITQVIWAEGLGEHATILPPRSVPTKFRSVILRKV